MSKLDLTTRILGEMRKTAITNSYLPKVIKDCVVLVNVVGDVIVSKNLIR